AIFNASFQVDLLHQEFPDLWKLGIYMDEAPEQWAKNSEKYKDLAQPIIEALENGEDIETFPQLQADLDKINKASSKFNQEVKERILFWMNQNKKVILLGGDHSTPMGYYEALATKNEAFAILHFDAIWIYAKLMKVLPIHTHQLCIMPCNYLR